MSEEYQDTGEHAEAAAPVANESVDSTEEAQTEQNVKLSALQSERAQRQELQDELRMMREHLSLLQSSQQRQVAPSKDELDALDDGDVLTVGEAKKALAKMNSQYQMSIKELKMTQKYPDYQEVISKYLPEVLKNNPGLRNTLESSQDFELAYYLAKNSENYKSERKSAKKNADAERIVENSHKARTLSSVGSTTPISQAKRYKDMNAEDFRSLVNRNLGGP